MTNTDNFGILILTTLLGGIIFMSLQVFKDEETIARHKDLMKRLRYLEFEFSTLTLKTGNFIAPYCEQKVIPSDENGYKAFLPKFKQLLTDFVGDNFMTPYIEDFERKNFRIFFKSGVRDYYDYVVFSIIKDFPNTVTQKLLQIKASIKRIVRVTENFSKEAFDPETKPLPDEEYFEYVNSIAKVVHTNLKKYQDNWLGELPSLPPNQDKDAIGLFKADYTDLLQYIDTLLETRREIATLLDGDAREIMQGWGISIDDRMMEILNKTHGDLLAFAPYGEGKSFSHLERSLVARVYGDSLIGGIERCKKKARQHLDNILYLQYHLEKSLGYDNLFTRLRENFLHELEQQYTEGFKGQDDSEKFEEITKEYYRHTDAMNFSKNQRYSTVRYSEILGSEQNQILSLLSAFYTECGNAIYHNPRLLEYFVEYRTRISRFFTYQHPNANIQKQTAIFPFHIGDGVIERYLVESIYKTSFDPLTVSDILLISDKKYRRGIEVMYLKSEGIDM